MIKFSHKKRRLFDIAHAVAMSSAGVGGRHGNNFRIGSLVTSGHSIMVSGTNSYHSSKSLCKFYVYPFYHAEAYSIMRMGLDACVGCDLYVARVTKNNKLALALPCFECMNLIRIAKIRNIYYSTIEGFRKL